MLDLTTLKKSYPENLRIYDAFILKEYLQYKILQLIFNSEFNSELCFLGGTCLRIVHGNTRFSGDLDFDNFGLNKQDFDALITEVRKKMELEGFETEIRNVFKGAYRCYFKFPRLLHKMGLSGYEEEKILIQIDTMKQGYKYVLDKFLLNKFDVFTEINVAPSDVLLAKKICAALGRKTLKGRDFFDIVFLFSLTKPNYDYLKAKEGISNSAELKARLLKLLLNVDMTALAKDVSPFLYNPDEIKRVLLFREFVLKLS